MPLAGLALPALESLTGGGALDQGSSAGPAISGDQQFGGIHFGPDPTQQLLTLGIGAAVVVGLFFVLKGK